MCGHVLNYTLTEGYTRLNMGIRKPTSSALIGAWPPAPPRSHYSQCSCSQLLHAGFRPLITSIA
eukprot:1339846-Pleurochrysis_carterae.AAC.1